MGRFDDEKAYASMPIRSWIPLLLVGAIVAVALGGFFGGGASEARATSGGVVRLETHMPERLRSGILFEGRFVLTAEQPIGDATIGISPEVWSRVTINTVIPEPQSQSFEDGEFRLHYGSMKAGERLHVRLESQVNPSRFGVAEGSVSVRDGKALLLTQPHRMLVFP